MMKYSGLSHLDKLLRYQRRDFKNMPSMLIWVGLFFPGGRGKGLGCFDLVFLWVYWAFCGFICLFLFVFWV